MRESDAHTEHEWATIPPTSCLSRRAREHRPVGSSLRRESPAVLAPTQVDGMGDMLGDAIDLSLRAARGASSQGGRAEAVAHRAGAGTPIDVPVPSRALPLIARTLLLCRNLALAPSTGQVKPGWCRNTPLTSPVGR